MIVHLVNDRTANWGGQFARELRERQPVSQEDFRAWVQEKPDRLRLGAARVAGIGGGLSVASVVAQKGYGPSKRGRIRYGALRAGLAEVAKVARERGASIHMPRIGAGQAGGRWPLVKEIVEEVVVGAGVPVTVYVPPEQTIATDPEPFTELRLEV